MAPTGGAWLQARGMARASEHAGAAERWAMRGCWAVLAAELGQEGEERARGPLAWRRERTGRGMGKEG